MKESARPSLDTLLVHAEFVRRLARTLVRDEHAADDVAQETLAAAIAYRSKPHRGDDASPRGLLTTIARHVASNFARGEKRRAAREAAAALPLPVSSPEQILEREALRRRVVEAVFTLAEPYRGVVIARYLDELSAEEIARRGGVSVDTIRTRLKRASVLLRARLDATSEHTDWRGGVAVLCGWKEIGSSVGAASASVSAGTNATIGTMGVIGMGTKQFAIAGLLLASLTGAWFAWSRLQAPNPSMPSTASDLEVAAAGAAEDAANESIVAVAPLAAASASLREEVPPAAADGGQDAASETLARRCVTEAGAPIAGADIAIVEARGRDRGIATEVVLVSTRTDAMGAFSLGRPDAKVASTQFGRFLRVRAVGFASRRIGLSWAESTAAVLRESTIGTQPDDVVLAPGATVSGVVLDQDDRPVGGAAIAIGREASMSAWWRSGLPDSQCSATTTADAQGRFTLEGVPLDWAHVYATGDQGLTFVSDAFAVKEGSTTPPVTVRVKRLGDAEHIVVLAQDAAGAPLPRAKIRHTFQGRVDASFSTGSEMEVEADAAGRYEFFTLPNETHSFELRDAHGPLAAVDGIVAGAKPVVLRARALKFVTVALRDEAGAVVLPGAEKSGGWETPTVRVGAPSQGMGFVRSEVPVERVGDDWSFAAPADAFHVIVERPGYAPQTLGPYYGKAAPDRIDVTLVRVRGLHGVVRAGSTTVAGAWIRLCHWMGTNARKDGFVVAYQPWALKREAAGTDAAPQFDSATSGADGSYSVGPRGAGTWFVRVDAPGFATSWRGPFDLDPATSDLALDIEMGQGGTIEGRVTRDDGASPEGLLVVACRGDDELHHEEVGADGSYRFEHLALGEYEVALREVVSEMLEVTGQSSDSTEMPPRDVQATVTEGGTAKCDLRFIAARTIRLTGTFRLGGTPRFDFLGSVIGRPDPLDFAQELFHLNRALHQGRTDHSSALLDTGGGFDLTAPESGDYRVCFAPRNQIGVHAHFEFPLRLDTPVTHRDFDLPVGSVVVTLPTKKQRNPPNNAFVLWHGQNGAFAVLSARPTSEKTYRFDDVPAGNIFVEVGLSRDRIEAAVRAGETTTVESK